MRQKCGAQKRKSKLEKTTESIFADKKRSSGLISQLNITPVRSEGIDPTKMS